MPPRAGGAVPPRAGGAVPPRAGGAVPPRAGGAVPPRAGGAVTVGVDGEVEGRGRGRRGGRGGRGRRRGRVIALVVLASLITVVLVAGVVAQRVSLNQYVITPGDATPVAQFIAVPAADNHPLTGRILLTDVYVTQLNALSYLFYRYVDSNNEIISGTDLLGSTPDQTQLGEQGYLQMAQAQSYATAAALSHLGYAVHATNAGALVYDVEPGSPAATTLRVGQVITAVNATSTPTPCALIDALHGVVPGTTVSLAVKENSISATGQILSGPVAHKSVRLTAPPKGLSGRACGTSAPTAYLGISPEQQQDWHFPVDVTVHTQDIGGPSAGLAMTLGIMDKLSSGRLTGARIVAATGTIDSNGTVGDVGGVAEKTIAVERAGATVFFVPSVELRVAQAKADAQLHVYGVDNLGQVLRILRRLGGSVPTGATKPVTTKPASAQAAP